MAALSLTKTLQQGILPAITFKDPDDVLPVAEAILEGGLSVLEIPFRTSVAPKAVSLIRKTFPELKVGAGTLLNNMMVRHALDAGAEFGLSPGYNSNICTATIRAEFPFIPGVMTPSEIEQAAEAGFTILKLFPAEQVGGPGFLKAIQSPYEQLDLKFIPMGGVNPGNLKAYRALPNVIAVGGSWLAPTELIANKNYTAIRDNIKTAIALANESI